MLSTLRLTGLRLALKRRLLAWMIRGIGYLTRRTYINWSLLESFERQGQPYILCVWHNTILSLVPVLGALGPAAMISRSRDGDDIAWVMERFGFRIVRGSPAEGGSSALREMLRLLSSGQNVILTPDGPRGPRYELKPGVTALARKKGLPIIPVACSALRRWQFGSWDRMRLPKPFTRLVVWVGAPLWIREEDDDAGEEAARLRVQAALRKLTADAERFTGADARYPEEAAGGEPAGAAAAS